MVVSMITKDSAAEYQSMVLMRALGKSGPRAEVLKDWNWDPNAVAVSDLSDDQFDGLRAIFGNNVFRIARCTPYDFSRIKSISVEGGSCLLQKADKTRLSDKKNPQTFTKLNGSVKSATDYLQGLPSEFQVADSILAPIGEIPSQVLYIGEDQLFMEDVVKFFPQLSRKEALNECTGISLRAAKLFSKLNGVDPSLVSTVLMSDIWKPLNSSMQLFFSSEEVRYAAEALSARFDLRMPASEIIEVVENQSLSIVLYTYTQHWAENVLIKNGYIDEITNSKPFVIAEPFYHFSFKITSDPEVLSNYPIHMVQALFTEYFQQQQFGVAGSANAFTIAVGCYTTTSEDGGLGYLETPSGLQMRGDTFEYQLSLLEKTLEDVSLPVGTHPLFRAGVNTLSDDPDAREALLDLARLDDLYGGVRSSVKNGLKLSAGKSSLRSRKMNEIRGDLINSIKSHSGLVGLASENLQLVFDKYKKRMEALFGIM